MLVMFWPIAGKKKTPTHGGRNVPTQQTEHNPSIKHVMRLLLNTMLSIIISKCSILAVFWHNIISDNEEPILYS